MPIISVGVVDSVQVPLEISVGQFVGWLVLPVVFVIFLDCIICQMNKLVVQIFHVELFRGRSDIPILVPIPFLIAVNAGEAYVTPYIELAFLIEKRHDILLNDVGARPTHFVCGVLSNDLLNLLQTLNNLYAGPPIRILPRFNQPSVPFFGFKSILELLILLFLFFLLDAVRSSLVLLLKLFKLFVAHVSDVKSHRNVLERIDLLGLVVVLQIHEKRLFVG